MQNYFPPKEDKPKGLLRNDGKFGLLLGFLVPLVTFGLVYLADIFFAGQAGKPYVIKDGTKLVIGVAINVILFRYYMVNKRMDRTGQGILAATFAYAILYVILFVMMGREQLFAD
ncbi:MAG: hypothetical protein ACT6QS_09850 [Flavobacteriales bacterium]